MCIRDRIGTHNPNTNPATVDLNFDAALAWVLKGAQPSDTVRNILSREGVYMKKHLLGGVATVSYTHLDVYKRQYRICPEFASISTLYRTHEHANDGHRLHFE